MKTAMILVIGIIIGALAGYTLKPHSAPLVGEKTPGFTQKSLKKIEELQKLSSPNEQLAQAEAYYGKAVVLFLASLANKSSQAQAELSSLPNETPVDSLSPDKGRLAPSKILDSPHFDSKKLATDSLLEKSKAKEEKINQERMINFQLAKPFTELTPQLKAIQGLYEGTFTIQTGKNKGRVDLMEFEVDLRQERKKLTGSILCKITDPNGFTYSNSLNTGGNNKLKPISKESSKIYMEPAPGSFIVLDLSNPALLQGEYYDKNGSFKGVVSLTKKNE